MKSLSEIENYLKNNPYKSDQKIAKRLGLDHKKVSELRSFYSKSPSPAVALSESAWGGQVEGAKDGQFPLGRVNLLANLFTSPYSSGRFLFLNLFLLALLVRLIYIFYLKQNPMLGAPILDAEYYLTWAKRILTEEPLGTKVFFTEPFYAYLLALFLKITNQGTALMLGLQILLGSILPIVVAKLAQKIFNHEVAILSGIVTAIYGPFIFYDALLLKTSLETFFLTLLILIMVKVLAQTKKLPYFLTGIFVGMLASLKGNVTTLIPVFFLIIILFLNHSDLKKRILLGILFVLGTILAISPLTIRNYIVGHDFVPTNYSVGMVLYGGNWWDFDGGILAPPFVRPNPRYEDLDTYKMAEAYEERSLKPSEVSSFWTKMAISEITRNPKRFFTLTGKKFLLLITNKELSDNYDYAFYSKLIPIIRILPNFWPIASLCLTSILLLLFSKDARLSLKKTLSLSNNPTNIPNTPKNSPNIPKTLKSLLDKFERLFSFLTTSQKLILSVVIAYGFLIVLGSVSSRYRVPLIPFLIILSMFTVWYIWEKLKSKNLKPLILLIPLILLFFRLTSIHLDNFDYMSDANFYNNLGSLYMDQKDESTAQKYFQKAIDNNKKYAWAYGNLFTIYIRHGEFDLAREMVRKLLVLRPDDLGNYYNLRLLKELEGKSVEYIQNRLKLEEGKGEDVKSNRYDPYFFEFMRYFKYGDYKKAQEYLEKSAAKFNEPENTMLNLAVLKRLNGDNDGAKDLLKRIIQKNPDFIVGKYNLANIYIKEKNWTETAKLLQDVYDLVPEYGEGQAWYYLATAYVNTDNNNAATPLVRDFIKHYQFDPTKKEAINKFRSLLTPISSSSATPASTPSATPK